MRVLVSVRVSWPNSNGCSPRKADRPVEVDLKVSAKSANEVTLEELHQALIRRFSHLGRNLSEKSLNYYVGNLPYGGVRSLNSLRGQSVQVDVRSELN